MNELSRRSSFIFHILCNSEEILSSQIISDILGISVRSVKNSINELKLHQESLGIILHSIHAKGYTIEVIHQERFDEVKLRYAVQYNSFNRTDLIGRSRSNSIIRDILLRDAPLSLDDLEESIFLSQSTIKQVLHSVRFKLSGFDLDLATQPYDGYQIVGNEINKRMCAVEMLESHHHIANPYADDDNLSRLVQSVLENRIQVRHFLLQSLYQYDFPCIDSITQRISMYLVLSLVRIPEHSLPHFTLDTEELDMKRALECASMVFKKMQEASILSHKLDLTNEIYGLAMIILSSVDVTSEDKLEAYYPHVFTAIQYQAEKLAACLSKQFKLKHYEKLSDALIPALFPIFYKVKFKNYLKTTLMGYFIEKTEIRKDPLSVAMAHHLVQEIQHQSEMQFDEYTVSILAVHLHAYIQMIELPIHRKRLIISSKNGKTASIAIRNQIENTLGTRLINDIHIAELYELRQMDLEQYDLVILGFAEYAYRYTLPYIKVNQILTQQDLHQIRSLLIKEQTSVMDLLVQFSFEESFIFKQISADSVHDLYELISMRHGADNQTIQSIKESLKSATSSLSIHNKILFLIISPIQKKPILEVFLLNKHIKWKNAEFHTVLFTSLSFHSLEAVKMLSLFLSYIATCKNISEHFNRMPNLSELFDEMDLIL